MSARWGQKNSDARARLAQSAERKALNLVVVGSSPTVGELSLSLGTKKLDARARLAQSAESKAFNLVVVGSSSTVGELCLPDGGKKTRMQGPA